MRMTQKQEEACEKAIDHFAAVFHKQGKVWPFEYLYGDGTLYHPLTRKGAETVYDAYVETLKEKDIVL